jgi:hypothetical protein
MNSPSFLSLSRVSTLLEISLLYFSELKPDCVLIIMERQTVWLVVGGGVTWFVTTINGIRIRGLLINRGGFESEREIVYKMAMHEHYMMPPKIRGTKR